MKPYEDFLRDKVAMAEPLGFHVDLSEINPLLKPPSSAEKSYADAPVVGAAYCKATEREMSMPTLFDLDALDQEQEATTV